MVLRCSELSDGSNRTAEESYTLPLKVPSFADSSGPRKEPPHCPWSNRAETVAVSPAHISWGETCTVPDGARYGRTVMVDSADASLYSGAAAASPILYAPGSRPAVPKSNERPWLVGWPLIDQAKVALSGYSPAGVSVTDSPVQ